MNWQQIYNQDNFVRHFFNQRILQKRGLAKDFFDLIDSSKPTVLILDKNCDYKIDNPSQDLITYILDGEPKIEQVEKFLKELPALPLNIVGIGGGSTIDFAKSIVAYRLFPESYRVGYDFPRELFENSISENNSDSLISIPTTVSSGSEASRYALLFFDDIKLPIRHWSIVPGLVILDSEMLKSFNNIQLLYQHFDTFIHALEVTYCKVESSYIAICLVKNILDDVDFVIEEMSTVNESNATLISNLQIKALMAGNAISNVRTGALHTVGESLASCFKNLGHIESLYFASANYGLITKEIQNDNFSFKRDFGNLSYFRDSIKPLITQKKGIEQTESFERFLGLVLSDKVLWSKEHFSSLNEKELVDYLKITWDTLLDHISGV